jgi:ABC-2 type transport system ATP-binding protein
MTGNDTSGGSVIEVTGLKKTFRSFLGRQAVVAVQDVSLQVRRGEVVAFVGPNGAGKTTTIYALLGLLKPDAGQVRLFGYPAGSREARRRTGFQPEIFYTYGFKTVERALHFYGTLSEIPAASAAAAVLRQIDRLGLGQAKGRKVSGFSKGMIQRLGLAQALLHEPDLLILDEPTTGLDPEGRKLVADIILEEKARGATVFLSSHILADVERTCDHVVILNQGRVVFAESMAKVRAEADDWEIEVLSGPPDPPAAPGLVAEADGAWPRTMRCQAGDKDALLLNLLVAGASIGTVRRSQSLEDVYMRHVGASAHG